MTNPATEFLLKHGHTSLVSLGCGHQVNRIDNHIRLMAGLNLAYYVGVDFQSEIQPVCPEVFLDPDGMTALLMRHYGGKPKRFWEAVNLFPSTWVEELTGAHCAVVVCQRVLPNCRWEDVILSMKPKLVLQEDLHGCQRQQLRGRGYVRTWTNVRRHGLQAFRPWPVFPGERNLILWRRQDFCDEEVQSSKWRMLWRLCEWFIG